MVRGETNESINIHKVFSLSLFTHWTLNWVVPFCSFALLQLWLRCKSEGNKLGPWPRENEAKSGASMLPILCLPLSTQLLRGPSAILRSSFANFQSSPGLVTASPAQPCSNKNSSGASSAITKPSLREREKPPPSSGGPQPGQQRLSKPHNGHLTAATTRNEESTRSHPSCKLNPWEV